MSLQKRAKDALLQCPENMMYGDSEWHEGIAIVAAAIRAAINDKLEEAAVELEALESGTYTATNTPAQLVRAMKVK